MDNIKTQCTLANDEHSLAGSCYAMGLVASYDIKHQQTNWWYQGGTGAYATLYVYFPSEDVVIAISQNNNSNDQLLSWVLNTLNPDIKRYLQAAFGNATSF